MSGWRSPAAALLAAAAVAAAVAGVLPRVLADEPAATAYAAGAATFKANCVVCHGADGRGQPGIAPPLTHYPARYVTSPEGRRQLAMTVLYGMYGDIAVEGQHYNFRMPNFSRLDDATLATLLNYVVFDVAHAAADAKPIQPDDIAAERAQAATGDKVREHRAALITSLGL
jgi:mono/diheme cytochrome c family protein